MMFIEGILLLAYIVVVSELKYMFNDVENAIMGGIAYVWMALYVYRMCNKLVDLFW